MIPYEELVAALTHWRASQGLPTGSTDFLGEPPPPVIGDLSQVAGQPDYFDADDMVIEDEPVHAGHLRAGDSTDTVDVSDVEILGEDSVDQGMPAAADYGAVTYDDPPLYDDSDAYAQAGYGEAPTGYDDRDNVEIERLQTADEEVTIIGGDGADEATRVAVDQGLMPSAPPVVDVDPAAARQSMHTDVNDIVAESELPPIPPIGAQPPSDSTIDVDFDAGGAPPKKPS